DRTGGDKGADPWNSEHANAGKPSQGASNNSSGARARHSYLRRLRMSFVTKILRTCVLREQDGDVGVTEARLLERFYCFAYRNGIGKDAKNSSILHLYAFKAL